jgi:hypothetical protein
VRRQSGAEKDAREDAREDAGEGEVIADLAGHSSPHGELRNDARRSNFARCATKIEKVGLTRRRGTLIQ